MLKMRPCGSLWKTVLWFSKELWARNGQVWRQAEFGYHYHYGYAPKVVIYQDGVRYRMSVEGVTPTILVERVK